MAVSKLGCSSPPTCEFGDTSVLIEINEGDE